MAFVRLLAAVLLVGAVVRAWPSEMQIDDLPGAVGLLQVSVEPLRYGHYIPDNGMCCVQGELNYVRAALARLRSSPLAKGYSNASADEGLCSDMGYAKGPSEETCFPEAKLYTSDDHLLDPTSEPRLMAEFGIASGLDALKKGLEEMCSPIKL